VEEYIEYLRGAWNSWHLVHYILVVLNYFQTANEQIIILVKSSIILEPQYVKFPAVFQSLN